MTAEMKFECIRKGLDTWTDNMSYAVNKADW